MPSAPAPPSFLSQRPGVRVLTVPPDDCVANVLVLDPGGSSHIIYRVAVVDGGSEGIWLAAGDGTGAEESRALAGFAAWLSCRDLRGVLPRRTRIVATV